MLRDIHYILSDWPVEPGMPRVRKFTASDGLTFLQVRVDLGVLQMAIDGRPDGEQPSGYETVLDCFRDRVRQHEEQNPSRRPCGRLNLSVAEWQALIREVLQYSRRRVGLIALAREAKMHSQNGEALNYYTRAIRDAEHSLAVLDFLGQQQCDPAFMESPEPYRPLILMQRAICQAECALLRDDPDTAIESLKRASVQIRGWAGEEALDDGGEGVTLDVRSLIVELECMERRIRRQYHRRQTLSEQLEKALAAEDYETAARLRDALSARASGLKPA